MQCQTVSTLKHIQELHSLHIGGRLQSAAKRTISNRRCYRRVAISPDSFDFIHLRGLASSIRDQPELLRQSCMCALSQRPCCVAHPWVLTGFVVIDSYLKLGGGIEVFEGRAHMCCDDDTYPKDC
jgi:hypothetical protein